MRRNAFRGAAALIGILLVPAGCGGGRPEGPRNLLLISVDTLRADHLSCYGYERRTTPRIDTLAATGIRFAQAWANSPWTLPSHATLLSGTHPFWHMVVDDHATIGASVPLLAPILKSRGYSTAAVDRGFDRFEDFGLSRGARPLNSVRASEVTEKALEAIRTNQDRPFFLFAHYFDPHNPYDPPEGWNTRFDADPSVVPYLGESAYRGALPPPAVLSHIQAQYDEEILYTDAMIGRLLEGMEAMDRLRDTLIVLTSDHGEEFFEHGSWGHGHTLYPEVLHVPLIVSGPGIGRGKVADGSVRHIDLAPTILDLLSLPAENAFQGRSFAGVLRGLPAAGTAVPRHAEEERLLLAETSRHDVNLVGAVDGRSELVLDLKGRRLSFFDLRSDPDSRLDLSTSRPEDAGDLLTNLLSEIRSVAAEHWEVSWRGAVSGRATIRGLMLGDESPTLPASPGDVFRRLQDREFPAPAGDTRIVAIPPDAPLEFLVDCGPAADCAVIGDRPAPAGVRLIADPLLTGARSLGLEPAASRGGADRLFRVRLLSPHAVPEGAALTKEELDRLRSLGYLH